MTRIEDHPAQLIQKLVHGARKPGVLGLRPRLQGARQHESLDGCKRRRLRSSPFAEEAQTLWILEILPRLAARHAQTFLDRLPCAPHYLRNLSRVITMQKTQDKDATCFRRFFAHAGVFTDLAQ